MLQNRYITKHLLCAQENLYMQRNEWSIRLECEYLGKISQFYSFCTRFKTHEKHPWCTSVHIWALFNSSIQSFLPISRLSSSLSLGKYLSVCSCSASSCQELVRGGSSPFGLQCNERLLPAGGRDLSQNCCITEQLLLFFVCSKVLQSNAQRYLSYMLLFFLQNQFSYSECF